METPLSILIVDDEPEARELLHYMLQHEGGCKVAGMAGDVDEALRIMKQESPDLVFLDIEMPGKDGFQFIEQAHSAGYNPGIIFVTAHDDYVIKAIRSSVFDYILKPIKREELFITLKRFRQKGRSEPREEISRLMNALRQAGPDKVKLNTRSGYILINPQEVVYCKADGNYTHIKLLTGNSEITTQNLGAIEQILEDKSFFRASRSYLVNLRYLSKVDRKSCSCIMEYSGKSCTIKIPAQKIRLLESSF
jgi:DNA-binding LytR/AlgR family response regulator